MLLTNFLSVLDPTQKLSYLNVAWEPEWVEMGMECIKGTVSPFIPFLGNSDHYLSLQNISHYILLQKIMQQFPYWLELQRKICNHLMVCIHNTFQHWLLMNKPIKYQINQMLINGWTVSLQKPSKVYLFITPSLMRTLLKNLNNMTHWSQSEHVLRSFYGGG